MSAEKMVKFFQDDARLRQEETLTTPYEQKVHQLNDEKLQYWSKAAQEEKVQELQQSAITNMTLRQIGVACVSALVGLYRDIAAKLNDEKEDDDGLPWGEIFTRDNRLIYIGLFILTLAIFSFLVELAS